MKAYSVIIFTTLLSACAHNSNTSNDLVLKESLEDIFSREDRRSFMIGRWYGKQPTKDGGVRQQINERTKNGTYKVTFLLKNADGEITEDIEVGQWGIVGPVYFSIYMGWVEKGKFHPSDPEDAGNYSAYEVLELNDDNFKYQSYATKSIYTLKKVGEDFEFPDF